MRIERTLRAVMLVLAGFDLLLGTALLFFGGTVLARSGLGQYAEPRFFMMCVGVNLYLYVYIQWLGFRRRVACATSLVLTLVLRASFVFTYLSAVLLWSGWTLLHTALFASAIGDFLICVFLVAATRRLGIGFFQGDRTASPERGPKSLRVFLALLTAGELFMGANWALAPRFWLRVFEIGYSVDPFWTRATGVLLLNIAFTQALAVRNLPKYRSAATASGLFRALWPLLYWYAIASGVGTSWFRGSILFFSFFNIASCIFIFVQLRRVKAAPRVAAAGASA